MKKSTFHIFRYFFLSLFTIVFFVFLVPITALAADPEQEPMYPSPIYDEGYRFVIDTAIKHHMATNDNALGIGPFFVYVNSVNLDSGTCRRAVVYICPSKDVVISSDGTYASGNFKKYEIQTNDCITIANINTYSASRVYFAINNTVRNNHIYVSQDIYNSSGVLMYKCPDAPENPYGFDIFQGIEDFTQSSINAKNEIDSQIPSINTSTDSTTNDGIFGKILQSIGTITNNISNISQQISNQLQNFAENFYNVFSDYLFNQLTELKDIISNILPQGFVTMVEQLYQSGLDSSGKFSLSNMFQYWFVPDVDKLKNIIDSFLDSVPFISQVIDISYEFQSIFFDVKSTAPLFVIPAGTYGFLTIPHDIEIDFSWFEEWKPYTDPLICAFLYLTYFWHLFCQLPGILSGASATAYTASEFHEQQVNDYARLYSHLRDMDNRYGGRGW